jgi:hypothetical protein
VRIVIVRVIGMDSCDQIQLPWYLLSFERTSHARHSPIRLWLSTIVATNRNRLCDRIIFTDRIALHGSGRIHWHSCCTCQTNQPWRLQPTVSNHIAHLRSRLMSPRVGFLLSKTLLRTSNPPMIRYVECRRTSSSQASIVVARLPMTPYFQISTSQFLVE